jgi:hypothetical protein
MSFSSTPLLRQTDATPFESGVAPAFLPRDSDQVLRRRRLRPLRPLRRLRPLLLPVPLASKDAAGARLLNLAILFTSFVVLSKCYKGIVERGH